ncbi:hypothetical protein ACFL6R_02810 [Gemmatimonadota bacterium]
MKKYIPASIIALLVLAISSSTYADPPPAYDGGFFTINKLGHIATPTGEKVIITGSFQQSVKGGHVTVILMQERQGELASAFGEVFLSEKDDRWAVSLIKISGKFKPGPAGIKVMTCRRGEQFQEVFGVEVILTGRPIK